ncbi:hypothetical protein RN001_010865 [Aquatica leii]|uniref:Intimal thickness related receptor IRP domain-containing protein n=1 Tax=Aquatica leii TaxID=1421715 RepID=A0AAN7PVB9_9COLE|nr:hypothetical protein RN001_010865 [Aquatica leii]
MLIVLTIAVVQLALTDCKYVEGVLKTNDNWSFLTRFCFLSNEGEFEYLIEFNEENGYPNLLLYYDADNQWPAVYKTNKTCYEKESVLNVKQNQIVNLTVEQPDYRDFAGCIIAPSTTTTSTTTTSPTLTINIPTRKNKLTVAPTDTDGTTESTLYNYTSTSTTKAPIRKRYAKYYINNGPKNRVIVCQNARRFQSIHIKYRILMTNGPPGDYWHEHFSADQFYILPVLIAYSIAYSLLILAILICSVELKSRQLLHSTYKLYVLSVIIQFFGIILQTAAYLKFAVNGIGAPTAKTFGNMMVGCSETCFLLLLLLIAKGYTVTRGRLPLGASVKLTIFMCLYSVFDPGEVLYLYESPAGYGLIVLRIIAWLMFVYSTVFTLKHYPEKSIFYYPFNVCGTLWFIAGPAFILSANTYIDKWVRESVVCAVLLLIIFSGHLMFLMLTLPSLANKNFPYHVRTSQIGIMEITDTTDERIIIPLTRRTEELCSGSYSLGKNVQNNGDLPEEVLTSDNITMQNVLSWSIAKNYTAFDVSHNNDHDEPESPISAQSPSSSISSRSKFNEENLERRNGDVLHDTYEYVKEVPVELFTVSRLVGKKDEQ